MVIKEIMNKNPVYLSSTSTVRDAAEKMVKLDCGFIPIGENDRLVGAVTDRDIVIRAISKGNNVSTIPLTEIMTKNILYCYEDDPVQRAIEIMSTNQIHRVAVLDKDKRFTGVVSLGDIARNCHDSHLCGEAFEAISRKH